MKIREKFVANSSTSSFVVFGIYFSLNMEEDESKVEYNDIYEAEYDDIYKEAKEHGLKTYVAGDDSINVGLYPTEMKDDETLLDFKSRILESLKKMKTLEKHVKDLGISKIVYIEEVSVEY